MCSSIQIPLEVLLKMMKLCAPMGSRYNGMMFRQDDDDRNG